MSVLALQNGASGHCLFYFALWRACGEWTWLRRSLSFETRQSQSPAAHDDCRQMSQTIYLDTARFGAILPECATMLREFASVLEAESQFPQFNPFLSDGSKVWPERLQSRYPTLARWQGINSLRNSVHQSFGLQQNSRILFSSSSWQLIRMACAILTSRCERILCTDLCWPEYRDILEKQAQLAGCVVTSVGLRQCPFDQFSMAARSDELAKLYRRYRCDGAFLTPVSHDGFSIDVACFLSQLQTPSRYCVVDGSQQAGHLPMNLPPDFEGVYATGTHKWLRSGMPLSIAAFAYDQNNPFQAIRKLIRAGLVDDHLLLQTTPTELEPVQQTIRLEPLLAASLSLERMQKSDLNGMLAAQCRNAEVLRDLVDIHDWATAPLQDNGIVVLSSQFDHAERARDVLAESGVTVSDIGYQKLRLSCPTEPLSTTARAALTAAFEQLSPGVYP